MFKWIRFTVSAAVVALVAAVLIKNLLPTEEIQSKSGVREAAPNEKSSFTILLTGNDESGLRPDSIMLVHIDGADGKIKLLSLPRDTKVYYKGKNHKLNSLPQLGGRAALTDEVEELTDAHIDHYIDMKTGTFAKIVDTLGGVEYTVEKDMNYEDPVQDLYIHLKAGAQTLNGEQCEQYCRYRRYAMGDLTRTEHQQKLLKELILQKNDPKYIMKLPAVFSVLKENSDTDFTLTDVTEYLPLVRSMAEGGIEIECLSCPGEYNDMEKEGVCYYQIDQNELQKLCRDAGF